MISEKDLRIGNWIEIEGVIRQVTAQTILAVSQYNLASRHDFCNPIPLSPEILEKAGFKFGVNENGVYFFDLNGIDQQLEIVLSGDLFYPQIVQVPEMASEEFQVVSLNNIQYVHQLQNLYYCLTGTELLINL